MSGTEAPNHAKQDNFVQIPISDRGETSLINQNQTEEQNRTKWWISVALCIVFVLVGQSSARLLENFYYDETKRSDYDEHKQYDGTWTQAFLQTAAFPLLLIPLIFFPSRNPQNTPPIYSDKSSLRSLLIIYPCTGIVLISYARLYSLAKLYFPFGFFTIILTTQLIFTPIITRLVNKVKLNRWIVISVILAIVSGVLTMGTAFGGEPDEAEEEYGKGTWCALFAAITFSLLLSDIQLAFDQISKRNVNIDRKHSFSSVFELLVFVSLLASIISLVGMLASGEHHELRREREAFSKGKGAYVLVLIGQAVGWQIYWVGIVGLVFRVSPVFANVVSVCVWPVVSVLTVLFFNYMDDEFEAFKGGALAAAALSLAAYVYWLTKAKTDNDADTR